MQSLVTILLEITNSVKMKSSVNSGDFFLYILKILLSLLHQIKTHKKMSKFHKSYSDLAHSWAHEHYDSGHTQNSRMFFNGPKIYSYGNHFMIAKKLKNADKNNPNPSHRDVILFTTRDYSSTTSGHKSEVWNAIPHGANVIQVPDVDVSWIDWGEGRNRWSKHHHRSNMKDRLDRLEELLGLQRRARKRDYRNEIHEVAETVRKYVELFRCKAFVQKSISNPVQKELFKQCLDKSFDINSEVLAELADARDEKIKKLNAKVIQKWRNGDNVRISHLATGKRLLRVVRGEEGRRIETSGGIIVTPGEGYALYRLIKLIRAGKVTSDILSIKNSVEYNDDQDLYNKVVNGRIKIANWTVDRIMQDGSLIAGCHRIDWKEISAIAETLEW